VVVLLEQGELLLPALDFLLQARERRGVLLAGLHVLRQPAAAGLVLRERGDEILARHAGIAHGDGHDLLLDLPDFADVRAQLRGESLEHARRQPQLHELGCELLAQFLRARVERALLRQRCQRLLVQLVH
jgi:hypothetical protein